MITMLDTLTLDAVERNAPDHKAAESLTRVEMRVAVQQALHTLSEEEQLVIRAWYGLGGVSPMDARDIANTYLIPLRTVHHRHNAAKAKLRSVLVER